MNNKDRKVIKTEHNTNVKNNLYKELVDSFCTSLKDIIDKKVDLSSEKITRKSIANDLEISEQALQNYESDRIVNNKLLPTIKKYFDVPYSTLFGEITSKDIESAKKELAIGLTKSSIDKLEKMQHRALNDTYSTNYEDKFKLFIINSIICDDSLINQISTTFAYYLGQVEIEKRLTNKNIKFKNPKDDYYLITLYRFISTIETRFDELAKSNDITPQIRKLAFKIAKKYSGEYQKYLK